MMLLELRSLLSRLLDEDGVRRPDSVLDVSLNDGYQVAALVSQGCELTKSFEYNADLPFTYLTSDFFLPISVYWGSTRLSPVRLGDLDQTTSNWIDAAASTPVYYFTVGAMTSHPELWLYPRPATQARVKLTYAAAPARLAHNTDIPRLPAEHHYPIVLWANYWELMKERGALLANKAFRVFLQFVQEINVLQQYVYRRTPDRDFQMMPWDGTAVQKKLANMEAAQQQQPAQTTEMRDLGA